MLDATARRRGRFAMSGQLPYIATAPHPDTDMAAYRKARKSSKRPAKGPRAPASTKPKTERIEARVSADRKRLLQQAADLRGETLSDFVLSASHEKAVATLEEARIVRLSADDQLRFATALLHPPAAARGLVRAAARYRERMGSAPPGA
jgi:uncharacterized protein (DUF1778 family)